jgi:hypothetical protein
LSISALETEWRHDGGSGVRRELRLPTDTSGPGSRYRRGDQGGHTRIGARGVITDMTERRISTGPGAGCPRVAITDAARRIGGFARLAYTVGVPDRSPAQERGLTAGD